MIIKSSAGTEIAKNGYTVIDELNQIPMIKTNYLQLEHNHINPIILGSKAFEYKDIFVNVVEDTETNGDTAFKEYNAIHEFAWILSGMRKHDSYTGYLSLEQYLTMVLEGTEFTYQVEGGHQYYALQFENLGDGESHLDMFFKMLNRWNTEFELRGKKVYITHQRGRLRDKHVGRYKMNIIDTIINSDITDGATAVWGYFGKKDEENPENSTYREFYWQIDELVEQYGIRYAKPYSNENITQEETMIEYLNNIILDSWKISTEVDIAEITDEVAQTGDEYVAVDERLGITLNTRIQKLESVYDADDKLLYQTATLGTASFASAASGSSSQLQEVIEKVKKDYNDRITDLKQEFDNRFNDEVTQIEIDFNELVNGVRQEIQADYDAMSNDFEQMKLTQQQRVDEIYEDIGGINQTVSDVANKADYLDGVYTDLSTQTGAVSSTVANIIDGKAPAGSVLKQTIDGVVGRVWEQDIDNLNFENRNLIIRNDEIIDQMVGSSGEFQFYHKTSGMKDFIKVQPEQKLMFTRTIVPEDQEGYLLNYWRYAWFDTEGNFISRESNSKSNALIIVPENAYNLRVSYPTDADVKIEKGSKATPYSPAPEDLMKYTDIVARPDGFLIGSFEMGGDKIAQAILGKAGAIDLIADNVNLSNNLNVANQIKSLSLETVYANISELRTRMLVADVITANMVKFDTALIEKFTSSTAFINSLTAKSAFINNAKVTELISTDGRDSFVLAGGMMNWTRADGLSMQLGISGLYMKNANGSIRYQIDNQMVTSAALGTSNSNVYLATDTNYEARVVDRNQLPGTGHINDYTYRPIRARMYRFPDIAHAYFTIYNGGEFRFTGEDTTVAGVVYQDVRANVFHGAGFRTTTTNLYLGTDNLVHVVNKGFIDGSTGTPIYRDLRANDIYNRALITSTTHAYVGTDEELRIVNKGLTGIYRDIRFSSSYSELGRYYGIGNNLLQINEGFIQSESMYTRTYSYASNMYVTSNGIVGRSTSARKYKLAIEHQFADWEEQLSHSKKILEIRPSTWFDRFESETYAEEIKLGERIDEEDFKVKRHFGAIADEFEEVGLTELVQYNENNEVEGLAYDRMPVHHNVLIKDLYDENDTLKDRINDLENKLNKIMEMIA